MNQQIKVEEFFRASNHKLIIRDIFAIYHHRWDVIGETVQNAVDSVLKRREESSDNFSPAISITYDAQVGEMVIEDNGMGIPSDQIVNIAAPHVSLKNPKEANRGEFGVGLTLIAFYSNDFELTSAHGEKMASLRVKNDYNWAMDEGDQEKVDITFELIPHAQQTTYTKIRVKPIRLPNYDFRQLEYVLRRHTAVGDFWSCYKEEEGPLQVSLVYINDNGQETNEKVVNKFWYPADYLSDIGVGVVDVTTVEKEIHKSEREAALPNWIGFGLIDKDTIVEQGLEFTYYALLCRTPYYKQLAEQKGIQVSSPDEDLEEVEETSVPQVAIETVNSGIFVSKKGMPLGAIVDHPRTAQAGYWLGIFIMMNCDQARTEPGRKKLHVDDEQAARTVAKKIFYKLTKYSHYFIPRDPDEEMEFLLRNVDKNIQAIRQHRMEHLFVNPKDKIKIYVEPINEQTLIGLFHEMVGAELILGYKVLKLSAADTYDGIYEYAIPKEYIGKEHWEEWLRSFSARDRKKYSDKGQYEIGEMIVEFKMRLEDVIKDFLQKPSTTPTLS